MNQDVSVKFKDFLSKRMLKAVGCCAITQLVLLGFGVFIVNISLFHPFLWLMNTVSGIFSFRLLFSVLPLMLAVTAEGILCGKNFITVPLVHASRFCALCNFFSFRHFIALFYHSLIGFLICWTYSSILDEPYNSFQLYCKEGSAHLSSEHVFLCCCGIWIGFYNYLKNLAFLSTQLSFPIIQQHGIARIKSAVFELIKDSFTFIAAPVVAFLLIYSVRGYMWENSIASIFGLHYPCHDRAMFFEVFSFYRIFLSLIFSTLIVFSLKFTELSFKVLLTERYEFSLLPKLGALYMEEALMMESTPIVQHLAYLDLDLMCENSRERRSVLFSVSSPGGHPKVWQYIKRECFETITKFTVVLNSSLKLSRSSACEHQRSLTPPPTVTSTEFYRARDSCFPFASFYQKNILALRIWLHSRNDWIQNLPPVVYLFEEVPEIRIHLTLQESQKVIWAAKSITNIACFSLTEDQYGILQSDLSGIIVVLVRLKVQIDALHKYICSKKVKPNESFLEEIRPLRATVKRCLYNISTKFSSFISEIGLSREVEDHLNQYLCFRE